MLNFATTSAFGALVDPEAIQKSRVNTESVNRVISRLEPAEAQTFWRDLRTFDSSGDRSDFLLGVLAVAAGKTREGANPVTIFCLRSNVVGVNFGQKQL